MYKIIFVFALLYLIGTASSLGTLKRDTKNGKIFSLKPEVNQIKSANSIKSMQKEFSKVKGSLPAAGGYLIVRNDAIAQYAQEMSLLIANYANTYTSMPPYSGSTDSATYTFSNFAFDIDLENFALISGNSPQITCGWKEFEFIFVFDYHVCAKSWPHPCENGWVEIYTTTANVELLSNLNLDFSGETVKMTANSVSLQFNQGDIQIFVQCTSTFCVIPVSDIANGVAQNFVTVFTQGLQSAINSGAQQYVNGLPTYFDFASVSTTLEFNGKFTLFPPTNPNLVLIGQGTFVPDNGNSKVPPFQPTISPDDSIFQSPISPVSVVFTDYMIRTAIWAEDMNGDFNLTITNSDLPASSPVHLNTNDGTMQSAVPGIASYPNMDIVVYLSLHNVSSIDIESGSIYVGNTLYANFVLTNSTYQHPGWELELDISLTMKISLSTNSSGIVISSTLGNWAVDASVVDSSVGSVNAAFFKTIILMGLTVSPPSIPPFLFPSSQGNFAASNVVYQQYKGYGALGATLTYSGSIPSVSCPGGAHLCPLQNTCCQWGSSYGCCTLPNAVCCPGGGCCPQGTVCSNGQCYS